MREPTAEMSAAKRRRKSMEPAIDVPSPGAKSTAQPATAPSPNGEVATQQPSMKKEPDYNHNDRIRLESMETKNGSLPEEESSTPFMEMTKSNSRHTSPIASTSLLDVCT